MNTPGIPRIDVVGLGPAGADLLTAGTLALIEQIEHRYVRTSRHPSASVVRGSALDHHYELHDDFAAVYAAIVEDLVGSAAEHGRVLYAVPGSPRVAEHTVDLLAERTDVEVVVHPALSFLDASWVALKIDPIVAGVRIIDGHRFVTEAAGHTGPLLVTQVHSQIVLSDIKLAIDDPGPIKAVVLQRVGGKDERIFEVDWADLDRQVDADHLTSIYIPELPAPVATSFAAFDVLVKRLRQDCPWDAEQTHGSLRRYLLEESYETLEALDQLVEAESRNTQTGGCRDSETMAARYGDLQEELGDLLYQIFFHAILASEHGWFDVAEVATGIHDKLFERHPHVFGDTETSLEELPAQWEAAKLKEKGRESVMDGIPAALPALLYATKVQKKALAIGESLTRESNQLATTLAAADESEVGELLFAAVSLARELGVDAESALRQRAIAFANKVRATEAASPT